MISATITPEMIEAALRLVLENTTLEKHQLFWELQDDGASLMILLDLDKQKQGQLPPDLQSLGRKIDELIPKRLNDQSWMISTTKKGEVVDTCFGGNRGSPDLGFAT
jgi:hypothetical protein